MLRSKWLQLFLILFVASGAYVLGLLTADNFFDEKVAMYNEQVSSLNTALADVERRSMELKVMTADEKIQITKRLLSAANSGLSVESVLAGYKSELANSVESLGVSKRRCGEFGIEWTAESIVEEAEALISHIDFHYGG